MNRRKFLKRVGQVAYITIGGNILTTIVPVKGVRWSTALASGNYPAGKRIIVIFCRGAFDPLAMFTPIDIATFQSLRSGTTTVVSSDKRIDTGLKYFPHIGLKDVFKDPNGNNYTDVAVIAHTGSLNSTRSHFSQQDLIESGSALSKTADGFLSRLATNLASWSRPTLAVGSNVPFSLSGINPALLQSTEAIEGAWSRKAVDSSTTVTSRVGLDQRLKTTSGSGTDSAEIKIKNYGSSAATESIIIKSAYDDVNQNQINRDPSSLTTTFSQQASLASMMNRSSFNPSITTLDLGNWDTHTNQGVNDGYFYNIVSDLGSNLSWLRTELKKTSQWKDTVVAVISEFGRTVNSNIAGGTDHGRGSSMLLMGGNVNPNHKNKDMTWDLSNFDGTEGSRSLLVKVDWRVVMWEVISKHLGVSTAGVFSDGYNVTDSDLLKVIKGW